ncbi:hypothetical protein cce_0511 [Crocosphaera subtropica ATCC 51142]|uniref:Class I SAM-dependent methyltransferase n=1 Tax=Crocosphaera subtropica (strain ATCC 51142 / BH68) TaxID=43989 RepID=B1WP80_CROS5|nr:hypothetical protein [Crocosphaera subtropica]ACB49862.1 hypothetical protein cce_0511 [Crocosphaera subtropica ATCC 51142]
MVKVNNDMIQQELFKQYKKEIERLNCESPKSLNLWNAIYFFIPWYRSVQPGANPLDDEIPWISFAAIAFLKKKLNKKMRVYEYGVGGSTIFFAKRVKEVISCEHDPHWGKKVIKRLKKLNYKNYNIEIREPILNSEGLDRNPSDVNSYISSSPDLKNYSFQDYVESIEQYPDEYFDVVLIDGRARPSCLKHTLNKIKKNGYIILDNAERQNYSEACAMVDNKNYPRWDFYSPGPYNLYFWKTCIWKKSN